MALRRTCAARSSKRAMSKDDQDSRWAPTRGPGKSRLMMTTQSAIPASEALGLVWVKCPFPFIALGLEAGLEAAGYVYCGQEEETPLKNAPSSVIYCPNQEEEDVASEVKRLRSVAGNVPLLVLGLSVDPQLAQTALLAGADGFIHLGMPTAQVVRALSAAFKGETIIPRDLLEAFLAKEVSRTGPTVLTTGQQRFLEMAAVSASIPGDIRVPRELLGAFLAGAEDEMHQHGELLPFDEAPKCANWPM
jgi:hypothetical protein